MTRPATKVPAPTAPVGDRRRRHHEHAHRQAVRGHHPLEPTLTDREVVLDCRERHVHDGGVEEDHEEAEAGGDEQQGGMDAPGPGAHLGSLSSADNEASVEHTRAHDPGERLATTHDG
jgi:hypothetical protein